MDIQLNKLIAVVTVMFVVLIIFVATMSRTRSPYEEMYKELLLKHQQKIAEMQLKLSQARDSVRIEYVTIEKIIIERDTVIEKIKKLPPEDVLAIFDSRTGGDTPKSELTTDYALVEMPRIEKAVEIFINYDYAIKERASLYRIIDLKDGEIQILESIISEQEIVISTGEEYIAALQAEAKKRGLYIGGLKVLAVIMTIIAIAK